MKNFITKVALFAILSSCNLSISASNSGKSPRSTTSNSSWEEFEKSIPLKDQMRLALLAISEYSAEARKTPNVQDQEFYIKLIRLNVGDYLKAALEKSSKK